MTVKFMALEDVPSIIARSRETPLEIAYVGSSLTQLRDLYALSAWHSPLRWRSRSLTRN